MIQNMHLRACLGKEPKHQCRSLRCYDMASVMSKANLFDDTQILWQRDNITAFVGDAFDLLAIDQPPAKTLTARQENAVLAGRRRNQWIDAAQKLLH